MERYVFQAYHLTETLKLKTIEPQLGIPAVTLTGTKLVFKEADASFIFLYRFGSVVFFNVEPRRQYEIIDRIRTIMGKDFELIVSDEYGLEVREGEKDSVHFERVLVDSLTLDRIDLVALLMAQSTALEYFENKVEELLSKSREISGQLEKTGRMKRREKSINRYIGYCMTTKQHLVASMYLLDKPDETWEDQVLDQLYREAIEMFELRERYRTIDHKLKMIAENLRLISNLLANRKAAFLELLIIVLIAVEIVLFIYELWLK